MKKQFTNVKRIITQVGYQALRRINDGGCPPKRATVVVIFSKGAECGLGED